LNKCQTAGIVLRYRYLQILSVCSRQKRDSTRERCRKPHAELSRVVPLRRDKGYWLDVERREKKFRTPSTCYRTIRHCWRSNSAYDTCRHSGLVHISSTFGYSRMNENVKRKWNWKY